MSAKTATELCVDEIAKSGKTPLRSLPDAERTAAAMPAGMETAQHLRAVAWSGTGNMETLAAALKQYTPEQIAALSMTDKCKLAQGKPIKAPAAKEKANT